MNASILYAMEITHLWKLRTGISTNISSMIVAHRKRSLVLITLFFFYSPHPYIFFNYDRNSMTFLGFRLSNTGDLLDPGTYQVLEQRLMDPTLRGQLKLQGVDFDVNYEKRDRLN